MESSEDRVTNPRLVSCLSTGRPRADATGTSLAARQAWAEVEEAIRELLLLPNLEVRIPRLDVLALEQVAMRDVRSVNAVLSRELLGFVSAEASG